MTEIDRLASDPTMTEGQFADEPSAQGPNNNLSKHEYAAESGDVTCHNCKGTGHFSRECPEQKVMGACFNCGQEGHVKSECTNARVFTGECRLCHKEGHPAATCPDREAEACKNCGQEGHKAFGCENARVFDLSKVPAIEVDNSWKMLLAACAERDMDDARDAVAAYCKAMPELTLVDLEMAFRVQELKLYLIATDANLPKSWVLIDLQGKLDRKYKASYHWGPDPRHKSEMDGWPTDAEENLRRLADAGFVHDRGVIMCTICGELGHGSRSCTEEKSVERVEVKCMNCQTLGHRVRDCPEQREDPFACRNCKQTGHQAADCTEPRSAEGVECKNCNEMGHFARDCPTAAPRGCRNCGQEGHQSRECTEPRNMDLFTCRNCEQTGHMIKECPLPTDWSKVKCTNCEEMGHSYRRCKQPAKDAGDATGGISGDNTGADAGGHGNFESTTGVEQTSGGGGGGW